MTPHHQRDIRTLPQFTLYVYAGSYSGSLVQRIIFNKLRTAQFEFFAYELPVLSGGNCYVNHQDPSPPDSLRIESYVLGP